MRASPWRRVVLTSLALTLLALSCTPGFLAPSAVVSLRILAVTADDPYPQPGQEVTLRMTVTDGVDNQSDPNAEPRDLQILWLGGCVNPDGDQYFLCLESLSEILAPFAQGGLPPEDVLKLERVAADADGDPDAHTFTFTVPEDIVSRRPEPNAGPHYGIAYVFFAACAGTIAPVPPESTGGQVPDFPLECRDEDGLPQGSDSFVIGYTQVYVFADGRQNDNPPVTGITLDGALLPEDPAEAPTVPTCPVSFDDRRQAGCAANPDLDSCQRVNLRVQVGEPLAEIDVGAEDIEGEPLEEVVWVSYFIEGGDLDPSLALINDATTGRQSSYQTEWTPPDTPGLYQVWAVVRDQRGGSSIIRRYINVE